MVYCCILLKHQECALQIPKGIFLNLYSPCGVEKVHSILDLSSSVACQNPHFRSNTANSSKVGITYLGFKIALFNCSGSRQILKSPLLFSRITILLTNLGISSVTLAITPVLSKSSSLGFNFLIIEK
ncbi:putative galacturonosyltransferase-like 4 [Frankliniella fusca]|uniref:Galacturonosyltransferase-like 4 n=1 Tax=Frankliniella fusca TaxID=407009 RepID=A0AAE1LEA1_9NEOP|nr:putative galacturonosyltransferase-like 4 [Frankliniella fusca]